MAASTPNLSRVLPRVLIVSRRAVRKNKFVDFVGEYHLDLIVGYGAVPVIVPRVAGVHAMLDSFEPIHGVLLCEGEDIDPALYDSSADGALSPEQLEAVRRLHPSDAAIDHEKDSIELRLARRCLERNIPYLGICRGSQVLNVACGGTLYQDVEHELGSGPDPAVQHINYDDYDGHRHPVRVLPGTPLHEWFADDLGGGAQAQLMVNSYHHQGVRRLAQRLAPMAVAPDGLVEGFYDPDAYCPGEGKFIMGLQFHPERMRKTGGGSDEFDYPGCARAYQEFVRAVVAYQEKQQLLQAAAAAAAHVPKPVMNKEMERRRRAISRSFSLAKDMYLSGGRTKQPAEQRDLEAGAEFLESNAAASLSVQQEKRLKQMGATVRNASGYLNSLKVNGGREAAARALMAGMTVEQLADLASFYQTMGKICSEVLDRKLQPFASAEPELVKTNS